MRDSSIGAASLPAPQRAQRLASNRLEIAQVAAASYALQAPPDTMGPSKRQPSQQADRIMNQIRYVKPLLVAAGLGCTLSAFGAEWKVVPETSTVSFVGA